MASETAETSTAQQTPKSDVETSSSDIPGSMSLSITEEHVLRGTLLSAVLEGMVAHFRARDLAFQGFSRDEAERMYAASFEVDSLDRFVSHVWRSSRVEKTLALLVYNNLPYALATSVLTCLATSVADLPSLKFVTYSEAGVGLVDVVSPWTLITSPLAFLLVLLFGQNVLDRNGRGKIHFIDKLCVCQYNEKKKKDSIYAFAALVKCSRELVMLWDEHYFTRLWCTLEMASFLHTHRHEAHSSLTFLPLGLSKVSMWAWLLMWFVYMFDMIGYVIGKMFQHSTSEVVLLPTIFIASYANFFASQKYLRQRRNLDHQIASFRLDEAGCYSESDRQIVMQTVKSWFGSVDVFDNLVHTTIKEQVVDSIGSMHHFPLRYAIVGIFIHLWRCLGLIMTGNYTPGVGVVDSSRMLKEIIADYMFFPLVILSTLPVSLRLSSALRKDPIASWLAALCYGCIYGIAFLLYLGTLFMFSVRIVIRSEHGALIGIFSSIAMMCLNLWLFQDSFKRFFRSVHKGSTSEGQIACADQAGTATSSDGTAVPCGDALKKSVIVL